MDPPPYSVEPLLREWRAYAVVLEQMYAKDVKEEILRRWYLVVARKTVARLQMQRQEHLLRDQSPADQRNVVGVLVVESKDNMQAVTKAEIVDPEHKLEQLLDSFSKLVKDRGTARRALKSVVGRGSTVRQGKLEDLEENFSLVSHEIGNLVARRVELEDLKFGFEALNDHLGRHGSIGNTRPRHPTTSSEPMPELEVRLPYSWGLVEGEDGKVRLPPPSTSVFEPIGRETAYSAAAQVAPPQNIDRLLRYSWIPRRPISVRESVSSAEAAAMDIPE
ncbi:hypothetical protein JCM3775_003501 [Rhodotorula graminis]